MKLGSICATAVFAALAVAAVDDYASVKRKLDLIDGGTLRAGSRVALSPAEWNAYIEHEVPKGVRNAKLEIVAPGVAKGTALINFATVQRAQGHEPGWLLSKLLDGERPVSVTAHVTSSNGMATVTVDRVEISGIEIDGSTLDFLIENFLLARYPTATVNRPFQLGKRIDRFDLQPTGATVFIGK